MTFSWLRPKQHTAFNGSSIKEPVYEKDKSLTPGVRERVIFAGSVSVGSRKEHSKDALNLTSTEAPMLDDKTVKQRETSRHQVL